MMAIVGAAKKAVGDLIWALRHRSAESAEQLQKRIVAEANAVYEANRRLFPGRLELPAKYGHGLPERAVELLLMRLSYRSGARVLDVGFANIMQCQRELMRMLPERRFTGIDIAKPVYNAAELYETMLEGSIVAHDFKGATFDLVWCVSTLEHMGMDNSGYTSNFVSDSDMDLLALQRMVELLNRGGALLLTVPYGRWENHGWMRNYDRNRWQSLLERVRPEADIHELYFRHTFGGGWAQVDPEELTYTGYYDQANAGSAGLAAAWIVRNGPATPPANRP